VPSEIVGTRIATNLRWRQADRRRKAVKHGVFADV
jgi:hypothetical protein